jgi:hypothetical protein
MYHTHTPKCGQFIILLVVRVSHTAPLEEVSDMQTSLQVRQIQVEYEYHALIASLIAGPWQFVSSFTPSISGAQFPVRVHALKVLRHVQTAPFFLGTMLIVLFHPPIPELMYIKRTIKVV